MKTTQFRQLVAAISFFTAAFCTSASFAQTDWSLSGNTAGGSDFLGTINEQDLIVKSYNTEIFRFKTNGDLNWSNGGVFRLNGNHLLSTPSTSTFLGNNVGHTASGASNTFIGYSAGSATTTGYSNIFMGTYAGYLNSTGYGNVFIGYVAGRDHRSGGLNVFIGTSAGIYDSTGVANTFVGTDAGLYNKTGYSNAFFGAQAGRDNTSGLLNTCLGSYSGSNNSTGSGNTLIGYDANVSSNSLSNAAALGRGAFVSASNTMLFGNTDVIRWGFGVNAANGHAIEVGDDGTNGNAAYLSSGGAWTNASDLNKKENIRTLNGKEILARINQLNITRWTYKGETNIDHIGPMAQDFYKLFNVGNDDKSISTIDPAGIALAGIKQLSAELQAQQAMLENVRKENSELKNEMESIRQQLLAMQQQSNDPTGRQSGADPAKATATLYQNAPNPFTENTVIRYAGVFYTQSAAINVYSGNTSALINTFKLIENGNGQIFISAQSLPPGTYSYELVIDGKRIDMKKMVIVK